MRTVAIVTLAGLWLLVDYPFGLLLFLLGGCAHGALYSAQEIRRGNIDSEFI